ncbi:MAG: hypothetical protein RBS16_07650 [Candidatus Cloacimonadales bacterium]|jgi:hypothetical protein|nr:hypothetical protein [Candidatus Cloacimonadota bacterium]MDD2651153.1 hypothetical protein [Candidatus Cloacimonadota bacterium]MDD3502221.1 hypothetical protein [Candidatus Cloacimonadota bacterium]MDX9977889.1 hypothetical protein [Candidatus Cloacimonadales bacterium]
MQLTNAPFSPEALETTMQALDVMLKGMFGVFIFMLVFYLLIVALRKIYEKKE